MSTPIRTVTFSATPSGVTPDQPQFAGVQGDHNATSVVFALDEALVNAAYQYRFEFVDGAGGYDTTDFVALENSQASCLLPGNWTGAGSTGTIRLCAVILGADNTEEQVVYTLSGRLKFAPRDTGTPMETEYETGLSGLIADTKDAADAANQAAADAETAADAAQAVADTVQQKLDNGEFIGPPGPKGNPGDDGAKGEDGQDGGWWTPSVDSSTGELQWFPSKAGMGPMVPDPVNIKGPPGPQGVQGQKGEKGEKGDPGEDGAVAITELSPGMFALSVNAEGHLILTHNDNEPAPPLSIQDGKLIYTIS